MVSTPRTAPTFCPDQLFAGALRGWLLGSCVFSLRLLGPCVCEIGRVGTFVFFEIPLSIGFAVAVILVGIPCFYLLSRLCPLSSRWLWGSIGGIAFAAASVLLYLGFVRGNASLGDGFFVAGLAMVSGYATLYFAK